VYIKVRFATYEDTMKTLHLTLVLIKIVNYVVRCTSYDIITLIFNTFSEIIYRTLKRSISFFKFINFLVYIFSVN